MSARVNSRPRERLSIAVAQTICVNHAKPFAVICKRFDGRDREYQRYETAELAELVARRLQEVGLEARVVPPTCEVMTP